jgi:hypothetical protein
MVLGKVVIVIGSGTRSPPPPPLRTSCFRFRRGAGGRDGAADSPTALSALVLDPSLFRSNRRGWIELFLVSISDQFQCTLLYVVSVASCYEFVSALGRRIPVCTLC